MAAHQPEGAAKPGGQGVLARMTRHGRVAAAPDRGLGVRRAFQRALRRAGAPFAGLVPEPVHDDLAWSLPVGDLLTALPDGGLLVGLDAPGGHRGLCLLGQPVVDALIEVQTTGRVDSVTGPARMVTKIDVSLTRDFIDLLLSAFAAEAEEAGGVDWPRRMSFGGLLTDRRQLPLLMPDANYHLFRAEIGLGGGAKSGEALLALPSIKPEGARQGLGPGRVDPVWRKALRAALGPAPVPLRAVLLRERRSLAALDAMAPGDLIFFDRGDLARIALEDRQGRAVLRGRLGQQSGKRALALDLPGADPNPPMARAGPERVSMQPADAPGLGVEGPGKDDIP